MKDLGIINPGSTVFFDFDSFASATGAPITITGLAVADIKVFKDGGTTERASTNGFTLLDTDGIDFDAITGIHGFSIDLADNTTADFWQAGSHYRVVISTITVDGQTMSFTVATFRIGYVDAILNTWIATLSSQTSFTLNLGPAEDDALKGMWAVIHDAASAVQKAIVQIGGYTGSSKTVTLVAGATFTVAAKDNISIMAPMPLQPTTAGRTLDVSTGGEAGLDWANIGSPTTVQNLTGTNIDPDQVVASVSGAVASVGTGGITTASFAAGAIDSAAIAADAIGSSELAASAVSEIQSGLATTSHVQEVEDKVDALPSAVSVAAAVWAHVITTGYTAARYMYLIGSALAGKLSGAATTNIKTRDLGDTEDAIDATVDEDGNRSAVTHGSP